MQTTREFLDEERENMLATQTEANDYLMSRLDESIKRIREDFEHMNRSQLEQLDTEYTQLLTVLEENLQSAESADDDGAAATRTDEEDRVDQANYAQLQSEHRVTLQELTHLTRDNQTLAERVFSLVNEPFELVDETSFTVCFSRRRSTMRFAMNVCKTFN